MANIVQTNGSINFSVDGIQVIGNAIKTYTMSGSNLSANIENIAVGSWQALNTSSISDVRYIYVNNSGNGQVVIAASGSGGGILAKLDVNDWTFIPWSGSMEMVATSYTSASTVTIVVSET